MTGAADALAVYEAARLHLAACTERLFLLMERQVNGDPTTAAEARGVRREAELAGRALKLAARGYAGQHRTTPTAPQ